MPYILLVNRPKQSRTPDVTGDILEMKVLVFSPPREDPESGANGKWSYSKIRIRNTWNYGAIFSTAMIVSVL
jgi:hypothetical protein